MFRRFNVAGSAPRLVAGENDLAQNPFNLRAEHGPSLFDARHRFVLSGSYEIPFRAERTRLARALFAGWQLNTIANFSTGTPFTVYDSANVSLQGSVAGNHRLLLEPSRPGRRSQLGSAHAGSVGPPLRVSPARSGDGSGTVRQRGPERGARARDLRTSICRC